MTRPYPRDPKWRHERARIAAAARYTPKSYIKQLRRKLGEFTAEDKQALAELLADALAVPADAGGEAA